MTYKLVLLARWSFEDDLNAEAAEGWLFVSFVGSQEGNDFWSVLLCRNK